MSEGSSIEWTETTWNPVTGCDRVSPGCDHCYALTLSARLKAMGQPKYQKDGNPHTSGPGFGVTCHWGTLGRPLSWRKPQTVFVNSMSDLFHPGVPDEFVAAVFAVMALGNRHRFQVLTKRPKRMRMLLGRGDFRHLVADALVKHDPTARLLARAVRDGESTVWPLRSVWLGVSVEDTRRARERLPLLADTAAAVRFISAEPLLEGIHDALVSVHSGVPLLSRMDWVIVGGESGPDARPMAAAWALDIRDACLAYGVPFFFKQWGGRTPKAGGRELDGRMWDQMPETPSALREVVSA
jgi:protein gp37